MTTAAITWSNVSAEGGRAAGASLLQHHHEISVPFGFKRAEQRRGEAAHLPPFRFHSLRFGLTALCHEERGDTKFLS